MSHDNLCFNGDHLKHKNYKYYHDNKWGKPVYDDQELFKNLSLEILQTGLKWSMILDKEEAISVLLFNFNIEKLSQISDSYIDSLMKNRSIIRHRKKLEAVRTNAQIIDLIHKDNKKFSDIVWSFFNNKIIDNKFTKFSEIPCQDNNSKKLSKFLKSLGLVFIGPKLCYSFMESCGIYNNHIVTCAMR